MSDIQHRIGVKASSNAVYEALTTIKGLCGWWSSDTSGDATLDGIIRFRFGEKAHVDVRVKELRRGELVLWEVIDAHNDWIGTHIRFDLRQQGDVTFVLFRHEGWKQSTEFMHHCNTKWATFLVSLKQLIERGAGAPFPEDVQISSAAA